MLLKRKSVDESTQATEEQRTTGVQNEEQPFKFQRLGLNNKAVTSTSSSSNSTSAPILPFSFTSNSSNHQFNANNNLEATSPTLKPSATLSTSMILPGKAANNNTNTSINSVKSRIQEMKKNFAKFKNALPSANPNSPAITVTTSNTNNPPTIPTPSTLTSPSILIAGLDNDNSASTCSTNSKPKTKGLIITKRNKEHFQWLSTQNKYKYLKPIDDEDNLFSPKSACNSPTSPTHVPTSSPILWLSPTALSKEHKEDDIYSPSFASPLTTPPVTPTFENNNNHNDSPNLFLKPESNTVNKSHVNNNNASIYRYDQEVFDNLNNINFLIHHDPVMNTILEGYKSAYQHKIMNSHYSTPDLLANVSSNNTSTTTTTSVSNCNMTDNVCNNINTILPLELILSILSYIPFSQSNTKNKKGRGMKNSNGKISGIKLKDLLLPLPLTCRLWNNLTRLNSFLTLSISHAQFSYPSFPLLSNLFSPLTLLSYLITFPPQSSHLFHLHPPPSHSPFPFIIILSPSTIPCVVFESLYNTSSQTPHSLVHTVSATGDMYLGQWKYGTRNGYGMSVCKNKNKIVYVGNWNKGEKEGFGTMYWSKDKSIYRGEWRGDMVEGNGEWRKGVEGYKGEWVGGRREGKGRWWIGADWEWEGEWKGGKREGEGEVRVRGIVRRKGQWMNDKWCGEGGCEEYGERREVGVSCLDLW
eukprot:TRINITY_DN3057_c1_g1_i1.p1 TRINITY_DN3057_c1_g1~~TRINITY_DN3057_c1_g1_i1.p1  ORF type:complete len:698 (+),score=143.20 TRINITY_DN3057_c1_g1_i1:284-2377(+)